MDTVIDEQTQRMTIGLTQAWERVLRLHVRPKPWWMPEKIWRRVIALVLYQSETQWKPCQNAKATR